ncbi:MULTISPECIES: hypothetical protein [unclassified Sphingomonas]|uniref:hypothetical protein n=1 Tax=unclassified Sphingomonas TaxID=196159 RepID=UPI0022B31C2B|nr:hypothetical protein [Sphingomonas sp. NIBR02145]WHU03442.1 hypothetical protein O3305_02220 [Sphingomonas sp. NIBR02145]
MSDPREMSGVWYGRYASTGGDQDNGFIAVLEEAGGVFSGSISEPDGQGGIRNASVAGRRSSGLIQFVKQYRGRWHHAVFYEGQIDDQGTEANGRWRLDEGTTGGFSMEREKFSVEELEAEEEEVLEIR